MVHGKVEEWEEGGAVIGKSVALSFNCAAHPAVTTLVAV